MERKRIFLFSFLLALAIFIAKPSHATYSYYEEDDAQDQDSQEEEIQYIQTENMQHQFNFSQNSEINLSNEEIIERMNEENEKLAGLSNELDLQINQIPENDAEDVSQNDIDIKENAFLNDPSSEDRIARSPAINENENTAQNIDAVTIQNSGLVKEESSSEELNQNPQRKLRSR